MKQILFITILLNLGSGLAFGASKAQLEAGSNEILSALNQAGTTITQALQHIVLDLRSKQGVCKVSFFTPQSAVAECLRGNDDNGYSGNLNAFVRYAAAHGKIDKVESAALLIALTMINDVRGDGPNDIYFTSAPLNDAPTGNGIPLPSLLTYHQNKLAFAALRKSKGREEILPTDLLNQMSKSFPRTMNGVGNVDAEQYFAAQMDRLQLNQLAGVMVTATDFLARPDAKIILYPADYSFASDQLKQLQQQEVALAHQILAENDANLRTNLQAQLKTMLDQTNSLRKRDAVDTLIDERAIKTDQLQQKLIQLATLSLSDDNRVSVGADFQTVVDDLNKIDQQLANLIRTEDVPPEDIQRFIINTLKSDFQALMQQTLFQGVPLQVADTLLAAWVSGDLSSDAIRSLSQLSGLQEKHQSVWDQSLSIGLVIGTTAMMAFPATAYIAIGISIFEDINRSMAAAKEKTSNETHLIPLN